MHGLEAALDLAFAQHLPGPDRLGEALQIVGAEVGELEPTAEQAPGARRDHHRAGLSKRLKSGGEVRRLARDGALLRLLLTDQVAHHDQAGRDPDPYLQALGDGRAQSPDRLGQLQPRAHRPFGAVLVRFRIAEIDRHPVAREFGDVALPMLDHLGAAVLEFAHERAHVLRVQPGRELGRGDDVAEQNGQLAPFRLAPVPRRRGRRQDRFRLQVALIPRARLRLAQSRNRVQQLAAVADHADAEILQIVRGQRRQEVDVDLVVPEGLLVSFQPQITQPSADIHLDPRYQKMLLS